MARAKKTAAAVTSSTEGAAAPSETPGTDATAAQASDGDAPMTGEAVVSSPTLSTEAGLGDLLGDRVAEIGEVPELVEGQKIWPDRLGHDPLMTLHLDGEEYQPGDLVFVTRGEFGPLRDVKVFSGEWEDGFEGLGDDDD